MSAGGFLLVWADGHPEASRPGTSLRVDFQWSQNGETIGVFDPLRRLVDSVSFGSQQPDRREGRWTDGAPPPFFRFQSPTPGRANDMPLSPPDNFQVVGTCLNPPQRSGLWEPAR